MRGTQSMTWRGPSAARRQGLRVAVVDANLRRHRSGMAKRRGSPLVTSGFSVGRLGLEPSTLGLKAPLAGSVGCGSVGEGAGQWGCGGLAPLSSEAPFGAVRQVGVTNG